MDTIVVGIDVSKDKLDIAVRPSKDVFSMSRDAAVLDDPPERSALNALGSRGEPPKGRCGIVPGELPLLAVAPMRAPRRLAF